MDDDDDATTRIITMRRRCIYMAINIYLLPLVCLHGSSTRRGEASRKKQDEGQREVGVLVHLISSPTLYH